MQGHSETLESLTSRDDFSDPSMERAICNICNLSTGTTYSWLHVTQSKMNFCCCFKSSQNTVVTNKCLIISHYYLSLKNTKIIDEKIHLKVKIVICQIINT